MAPIYKNSSLAEKRFSWIIAFVVAVLAFPWLKSAMIAILAKLYELIIQQSVS